MKKQHGQKIADKSCQSNFNRRLSDFGSFLFLITTVMQIIDQKFALE